MNMWEKGGCNNPEDKPSYSGFSWSAYILPYLEEESVYDRMDLTRRICR